MSRSTWKLVALMAALCAPAVGHSTTVEALDLNTLNARAERVVAGQIQSVEARWEGHLIVTRAEVAVETCLKGPCEAVETLEVIGGQVGDLVMQVDGMARFTPGEEVLLFLAPVDSKVATDRTALRPVGLAQGKFRVRQAGPETIIERDLAALDLIGDGAARALALEGLPLGAVAQLLEEAALR